MVMDTGFESVITESDDTHDEWGPGGFTNPVASGTDDDRVLESDYTQQPGTLIPAAARPIVPKNRMLFDNRDAVVPMAADTWNPRAFLPDNTRILMLAPYSKYRRRLHLDWVNTTNLMFIGRQTALEAFIGQSATAATAAMQISGTFPLNPLTSGKNTRAYMDIVTQQAIYVIGLCAATTNLCLLNVFDETWNGDPQIG